ncbi:hypothetical protein N658DRAFT_539478 [Parathielavia hyrcaniae]|uniref:MYND-type domain-containing protein n=1 Tax=Parathielavia hyrcaniae TaxID=113614 RepID=A0AAN6PXV3_9PEZI|nr:hypothetical protein N658DRAFT_539478 [Parathielavia hyrcaniae]
MTTSSGNVPACANVTPDSDSAACNKKGAFACGKCNLVSYCGKQCQTAHWPVHQTLHKDPANRSNWRPAWDIEGREPAWAMDEARNNAHNPYGGDLFLWGNVPAIDVLRLSDNEGAGYSDDIELLFAGSSKPSRPAQGLLYIRSLTRETASGDLRNVVKTIVDLPATVTQIVHATINGREMAMLIHLWYSTFMPEVVLSTVQKAVKPLIVEVCAKIKDKHSATYLGKTWQFPSGRRLRLVLKRDQWFALSKMLDVPQGFTFDKASKVRHGVTLAPERADYRDRWDFKEPTASIRIAKRHFREDGLLLPFRHPRRPLEWLAIWEIYYRPWPAKQDCYGKLHAYLREVFGKFVQSLKTVNVSFEMHCLDARDLKEHLDCDRYTRIEVSNVTDGCNLGLRNTLTSLMPLLQPPQRNPHATLISLFLNAVMDMVTAEILEYLPVTDLASFMNPILKSESQATANTRVSQIRLTHPPHVDSNCDVSISMYRAQNFFEAIAPHSGAAEKENNTIVEKWPLRLKRQLGQERAQEEFGRYVEWTRLGVVPETTTGNDQNSGEGNSFTRE